MSYKRLQRGSFIKRVICLFTKTPFVSVVKSRLATDLGKDFADKFFVKSLNETLRKMKTLDLHSIVAVAESDQLNSLYYKSFDTVYQGEGELGDRLSRVYDKLIANYDEVYFIGADSAHISFKKLYSDILSFSKSSFSYLLGPARDGGYYIFGGKADIAKESWLNVPYSCSDTFSSFKNELKDVFVLDIEFDIDDLDSLLLLKSHLNLKDLSEDSDYLNWIKKLQL